MQTSAGLTLLGSDSFRQLPQSIPVAEVNRERCTHRETVAI